MTFSDVFLPASFWRPLLTFTDALRTSPGCFRTFPDLLPEIPSRTDLIPALNLWPQGKIEREFCQELPDSPYSSKFGGENFTLQICGKPSVFYTPSAKMRWVSPDQKAFLTQQRIYEDCILNVAIFTCSSSFMRVSESPSPPSKVHKQSSGNKFWK